MKSFIKKYALLPALFIALMLCGAMWDLPINTYLFNPSSILGIFMESFGFLPLYLPTCLLAAAFAFDKNQKIAIRTLSLAIYTLLAVALINTSFGHLAKRCPSATGLAAMQIAVAVVLIIAGVLIFRRIDTVILKKLRFLFEVGFAYMVLNNIVVNILKLIWQRTRYDDMLKLGDMQSFTPWYMPFGNGGSSFPSGHTAAACGIFVLVTACSLFAKWQGKERLVYALCWAYVALMAIGRIIIGRHFLSDTVAAAFIGIAIYFAMTKTSIYKKYLLQATQEKPKGAINEADS